MPAKQKAVAAEQKGLVIPALNIGLARFDIEGLTPMILHGRGPHIIQKKQGGVGPVKNVIPTVEEMFRRAIDPYLAPGSTKNKPKIRVPAVWFKEMLVHVVGRHTQSIKLNTAGGVFQIMEDWVPLKHSKVYPRKDLASVPPKSNKLVQICRGQIDKWSCSFTVRYNMGFLDETGLATLVETAGFANGLGDWRPQKDGTYGQFQLKRHAKRRSA